MSYLGVAEINTEGRKWEAQTTRGATSCDIVTVRYEAVPAAIDTLIGSEFVGIAEAGENRDCEEGSELETHGCDFWLGFELGDVCNREVHNLIVRV
jgi:hypothetical protein